MIEVRVTRFGTQKKLFGAGVTRKSYKMSRKSQLKFKKVLRCLASLEKYSRRLEEGFRASRNIREGHQRDAKVLEKF